GHLRLEAGNHRRQGHGDPRGGRRPGDAGSRPAGGGHHRLAPDRAPLHQASGHHEGQDQATGDGGAGRPRGGSHGHAEDHPLRPAAEAQQGRDGQGCGRARGRAQAEGVAVMAKVLVIAEHLDGRLNGSTARTVSAAAALNPEAIDVAVLAADPAGVAAEAAQIAGVTRVLAVANPANAHAIAQVQAPQIARLAAGYTHVFAPSTTFGKDLLPCVAALLGVNQVSDLMAVEGPYTFKRPIYAGNAIITVEAPADQMVVATVRTASWPEAARGGSAPVEAVSVEAELPAHTRYVGLAAGQSDRPDLQSARRVVSGGRGVGSKENFEIIYRLADKLGAAVGASRAAVDAGYCPNEMQVGQTGKIIAPELYIAVGISGAIQHLTGIKDAGTIVAINKDPDAPIFEVADIGLVGDLFSLLPELEAALD